MKMKTLGLMLTICLLLVFNIQVTSYAITTGVVGDADFTLDNNGVLTLTPSGSSYEYNSDYFAGDSRIKKVILDGSFTAVGSSVFKDCENLAEIELSEGLTDIGTSAFEGTQFYNDENNWTDGVLYIDSYLIQAKSDIPGVCTIKPGTALIAQQAFYSCENLTGVQLPDSLRYINGFAFAGCDNLDNVIIPGNVETIGGCAFYSCDNLEHISIEEGVKEIGEDAFGSTPVYYYYNWENSAVYIDSYLIEFNINFNNGEDDEPSDEFTARDGTTLIATSAFAHQDSLKKITLPESVNYINDCAFYFCTALEEINLSSGVNKIGQRTFSACNALKELHLPDNLTSIGEYAFDGCEALTTISIPNKVTEIENDAFSYCTNLKSIFIPKSVTKISLPWFLTDIYYEGSREEWLNISYEPDDVNMHYNVAAYIKDVNIVNDGGEYRAEIEFNFIPRLCTLVTASYSDTVLEEVNIIPIQANTYFQDVPLYKNNITNIKLFIWDSLNGMMPLCEAKNATVSQ